MRNKKIVFHVTKQYMLKNKNRTIVTLLGIIMMVVMMTCVFVGKDTAIAYLVQVSEAKSGKWHIAAYDLDENSYQELVNRPEIEKSAICYDLGFSMCEQSQKESRPFWEVKAYSDDCFDWNNITLVEGRLPETENEIIISETAIKDGANVAIGDNLHMQYFERSVKRVQEDDGSLVFPFYNIRLEGNEEKKVPQNFFYVGKANDVVELHHDTGEQGDYTVVGIMRAPSYEEPGVAFYAGLTFTTNEIGNREKISLFGQYNSDYSIDGLDWYHTMDSIAGENQYEVNDMVLTFSGESSETSINTLVNFFVAFFVIFILIVSIILIYNVFNISFAERSHYLGILSSAGATKQQKSASVYYEAVVLLVVALPIGILLGFGAVKVGMAMLQPHINRLLTNTGMGEIFGQKVHLVVNLMNVFLIMVASFVTVWISSLLPARKISKIGPVESMRGNLENGKKRYKSKPKLLKKGRVERLLAWNHLHRQRYKSRSIVRAIAVFLIVLLVTTYGANSIIKMVHYRLVEDSDVRDNMDDYDYVVSMMNPEYEEYIRKLLDNPDVEQVKEWCYSMWCGTVDEEFLSTSYWDAKKTIADQYFSEPLTDEEFRSYGMSDENGKRVEDVSVLGVDSATFLDMAKMCGVDLEILENQEHPCLIYNGAQISTNNLKYSESKPKHYQVIELEDVWNVQSGSRIPLSVYCEEEEKNENFNFDVVGIADAKAIEKYVSFSGEFIWIITAVDTQKQVYEQMYGEDLTDQNGSSFMRDRTLYVKLANQDGELANQLEKMSQNWEMQEVSVMSRTNDEITLSISEAIAYIIRIIAICFVAFTALVCLLNLYNSIRARAMSRKTEIAMLRSVGMEEKQLQKMLFFENLSLWGNGFLWSLVFAIPIMIGIKKMVDGYFGQMKIASPWMLFGISLAITIISLIVMSKVCYHMKEDESILETIRSFSN